MDDDDDAISGGVEGEGERERRSGGARDAVGRVARARLPRNGGAVDLRSRAGGGRGRGSARASARTADGGRADGAQRISGRTHMDSSNIRSVTSHMRLLPSVLQPSPALVDSPSLSVSLSLLT